MKKSKTILLAAVLVLGSLFTSCSSDDDTAGTSIVGVWKTISSVGESFDDDVLVDREERIADEKNYATYTFNTDGTFLILEIEEGEEPYTTSGTYITENNKLSLSYAMYDDETELEIEGLDYSISGNTLTTVNSDEDPPFKEVTTATFKRQ